ncbi:MAG: CoA transferase [Steroidobacteraceae bacterium]|nr:CoA transferase [Steroidobacteraceae bacterium]MCW5573142.1 CoA transferase [Steroidobacteraceae bacterium]
MPGPLHGIRVVELTSVVLGPWACQFLGDMGADVIKIEAPRGDSNRTLGAARHPGMAALYLSCNRNKRSVVLDLKKPGAREALLQLVATADVFVHNNRPQVMTKLGLEYADLKKVNPRIIYCGAYGYSKRGPYGAKGALDDSIQAASGIAMLNERVLGEPRYLPTVVADKTTAVTVVYAVLAALFHRERSGEGQDIEVPMFETMVHFVMGEHLWGMTFDPPIGGPGYTRLMSQERRPYPTRDGYIAILPYLDAHWAVFCEVVGRPDLLADPRFRTLADRVRHIDATYAETAKIMATRTTQEWLDLFGKTSVPTIVVNSLEELASDPHLEAVGFWKSVDHPTEGKLRLPAFPVNFGATPAGIERHAPRLGEHTREVLGEAGLDGGAIEALLASGAAMTDEQAVRTVAQGAD